MSIGKQETIKGSVIDSTLLRTDGQGKVFRFNRRTGTESLYIDFRREVPDTIQEVGYVDSTIVEVTVPAGTFRQCKAIDFSRSATWGWEIYAPGVGPILYLLAPTGSSVLYSARIDGRTFGR